MKNNSSVDEIVKETVSALNALKPCKSCIYSNEDCSWCFENKIRIYPFQYGCNKHITNEEAVRKLAEIELEKQKKEVAKLTLDMDIMGYAINAASIILEKIDNELERSYNSIKSKSDETIKNHQESKKNRDRLRKAYAQMKANATDMRNTYNRYIEYFFTHQFTDLDNKYDVVASDKNLANSGIVSKVIKLFVDRALENEDNANKIVDYMMSLKGSGIYEDRDFDKGLIQN